MQIYAKISIFTMQVAKINILSIFKVRLPKEGVRELWFA